MQICINTYVFVTYDIEHELIPMFYLTYRFCRFHILAGD